ncbi:hypothetical protein [Streptomyces sp. NPDC018031]|uniref:hypothetical protein n=1 Tax=Streptomyces sp. NPDC018031 TaxID=3365033 RepID=UPI0037ACB47F
MWRIVRRHWALAACVLVGVAAVAAVAAVLRASDPESAATLLGTVAGVAGLLGPLEIWLIRTWRRDVPAEDGEPLHRAADALCVQIGRDWTQVARERRLVSPAPVRVAWRWPSDAITGPVAEAVGRPGDPPRFRPLPGLRAVTPEQLRGGHLPDLLPLYGGLDSGRLVLVGGAGAGKTAAAIRLLLDLVDHRGRLEEDDRAVVPVPVLLTLQGWEVETQPFTHWLVRQVETLYPLLAAREYPAGTARRLVAEGRVAVILDGLDELPDPLQSLALQALDEQVGLRVVLLSRRVEMVRAAMVTHLAGAAALELLPVDAPSAADYLERCRPHPLPAPWQAVAEAVRSDPAGPVAQALDTPLMLTLVRDTYRAGDPVGELLSPARFPTRETVEDHLLERVLPSAYRRRTGQPVPRYQLDEARGWLGRLASLMERRRTPDLAWWQLVEWTPRSPRTVATWLVRLTLYQAVGALGAVLAGDPAVGGMIGGLVLGTVFSLVYTRVFTIGGMPRRLGPLRWDRLLAPDALKGGALVGLGGGMALVLAVGLAGGLRGGVLVGLGGAVASGVMGGLAAGLAGVVAVAVSRPAAAPDSPMGPLACWRRDRGYGLLLGLVIGVGAGLAGGAAVRWLAPWLPPRLAAGHTGDLPSALTSGVLGGLTIGFTHSATWSAALACWQLRRRYGTPLRLLRFLDDAHRRGVLRTVGPVYQFRHARLRERLASSHDD